MDARLAHATLRRQLGRERRAAIAARLAIAPASTGQLAEVVGSITTRELLSLLRTMRAQGMTARDGDWWSATGATVPARRKPRPYSPRLSIESASVRIVPAVQIGLQRDALVAALFGATRRANAA